MTGWDTFVKWNFVQQQLLKTSYFFPLENRTDLKCFVLYHIVSMKCFAFTFLHSGDILARCSFCWCHLKAKDPFPCFTAFITLIYFHPPWGILRQRWRWQKVVCLSEIFCSSTLLLLSCNDGCDAAAWGTPRWPGVMEWHSKPHSTKHSKCFPIESHHQRKWHWSFFKKNKTTYSHNIPVHCRALKYYFDTIHLVLTAQGNKLSASLFDSV